MAATPTTPSAAAVPPPGTPLSKTPSTAVKAARLAQHTAQQLQRLRANERSLRSLWLTDDALQEHELAALIEALRTNTTLRQLYLPGSCLSAAAIELLVRALLSNPSSALEAVHGVELAECCPPPAPEAVGVGVDAGVGALRPPSECRGLPTLPERNAAVLGWVHRQHLASVAGDRAVAAAATAAEVAVTPVRGRESTAFANQPGGAATAPLSGVAAATAATAAAIAAAGGSADEVVGRALRRVVRMCVRGSVAPPLLCSAVRGLLDAARCSSPRYQRALRRVVGTHGWLGQRFRWALPAEQQQQLARELAAAKDCAEQQQQQRVGTEKGEQAVTALLLDAETQREGELHCWASNAVAKPLQSGKQLHRFWSHDWVRATM
jgi:hypothetical protein